MVKFLLALTEACTSCMCGILRGELKKAGVFVRWWQLFCKISHNLDSLDLGTSTLFVRPSAKWKGRKLFKNEEFQDNGDRTLNWACVCSKQPMSWSQSDFVLITWCKFFVWGFLLYLLFYFILLTFWDRSNFVAQAGLELELLLPPPPNTGGFTDGITGMHDPAWLTRGIFAKTVT
jgi:hypothetical protein